MVRFSYTVRDELGIHARPAGLLAKLAGGFTSKITIQNGQGEADGKRLIALMKLGVVKGQTVDVIIDGDDEASAMEELQKFMQENL